jgi:hypothetical protein
LRDKSREYLLEKKRICTYSTTLSEKILAENLRKTQTVEMISYPSTILVLWCIYVQYVCTTMYGGSEKNSFK